VQQSPVVQQNPNIQQIPSAWYVPQQFMQWQQIYTDSNWMQIQWIYPNQPEKTNNHVWLKIILIFLLLLWGWIFILCKMFPSEVNDIIKSIKWEDTTKIEYSWAQNPSDSDSSEWEMTNLEIIDDNEISETIWDTEALDENQLHWSAEELDSSTENEDSFAGSDGLSQLLDVQTNEDENMWQQDEWFQPIDGDWSQESIDMMWELWLLIDDERSDILDMINLLESYEKQWQIYQELWANQNQSTVYKYATFILNKSKSLRETIETTWEMDINSLNQTISQFDSYLSKMSALVSE
jgi:hypothetical protein